MAYSRELRQEILRACDRNEGTRVVALRYGVSESWVRRVRQLGFRPVGEKQVGAAGLKVQCFEKELLPEGVAYLAEIGPVPHAQCGPARSGC
jgi:hypothetical protein